MNYPPRGDRVLVRRLEAKLSAESLKPSYVVLTSGPRHLEAKAEGEDRQKDRAVEVCVAIDHQVEKRGGAIVDAANSPVIRMERRYGEESGVIYGNN